MNVTMELQAMRQTVEGYVVDRKIPLVVTLNEKSPDQRTLRGISEWFGIVSKPEQEGVFYDRYLNKWTLFYMPPGTLPRISWHIPAADLNRDDEVNASDLVVLSQEWLQSLPNIDLSHINMDGPDYGVNMDEFSLMAGMWGYYHYTGPADYNRDNLVNLADYRYLANSWLKNDPNVDLDGDPNQVNVPDLVIFCDEWLKGFKKP